MPHVPRCTACTLLHSTAERLRCVARTLQAQRGPFPLGLYQTGTLPPLRQAQQRTPGLALLAWRPGLG